MIREIFYKLLHSFLTPYCSLS